MQQRYASGRFDDTTAVSPRSSPRSSPAKLPEETMAVLFSYGTVRLLIDQHISRRSSSMPSGPSEGTDSGSRESKRASDRTPTTSRPAPLPLQSGTRLSGFSVRSCNWDSAAVLLLRVAFFALASPPGLAADMSRSIPGKIESIGDGGSHPPSSGAYLAEGKMQLRAADEADDPLRSENDEVGAVATLRLSLSLAHPSIVASSIFGRRHAAGFSLYSNVASIIIVPLYLASLLLLVCPVDFATRGLPFSCEHDKHSVRPAYLN
mmetsp:Transcript_3679/g.7467  ORF Transcript_3679/g.7467 Transcript_3679/m.7467 type:complete len:263 (+) Transcript_3679:874-1662(+)